MVQTKISKHHNTTTITKFTPSISVIQPFTLKSLVLSSLIPKLIPTNSDQVTQNPNTPTTPCASKLHAPCARNPLGPVAALTRTLLCVVSRNRIAALTGAPDATLPGLVAVSTKPLTLPTECRMSRLHGTEPREALMRPSYIAPL